jgi:hypothetical protein
MPWPTGSGLTAGVTASAAWYGYVSEAGAADAPLPEVYRFGMFAVAAAMALLGVSLRGHRGSRKLSRHAALALVVAAPLAATSGAVTCSPGCPLPPYEASSAADLVHAAASIGALLLAGAAMVLLAAEPSADERVRWVSRAGAGLTLPLLAAAGLAILGVGRGYVTGVLERAALASALTWLVLVAATAARTRRPR